MERVNDAYNRRDLASYMATHDKNYMTTNVMGQKTKYLQVQNGVAKGFAQKHQGNLHYTIQSCIVHGSQAKGIVAEHFVDQQTTYSPKWVAVRNALEVITWRKNKGGWHMTATQMIRDVEKFQRI